MPHEIVSYPLSELVAQQLVDLINAGVFAPGDRLVEESLARELGTSRIPVREALRALSSEGIVEHTARKGYRVGELNLKALNDIFSTRAALEKLAFEQILALPQPDFDAPRSALDALRASVSTVVVKHAIESDLRFHRSLVAASGNRTLDKIYTTLTSHLVPALALMLPDELNDELVAQHADLLWSLERRDADSAASALEHHHAMALIRLRGLLDRREVATGGRRLDDR